MAEAKNRPAEDAKQGVAEREIVISRVINAPREMVWKAFSDPNQVSRWWGPNGFSHHNEIMDFRPGGTWKHMMTGPDGTKYPNKSIFKEIRENELIVYAHAGGKEEGGGAHFEARWSFEAQGSKTKLTGRMIFETAEARDFVVKNYNAIEGGNQTLGRLEAYLKGGVPA